jgi:hypothetical protein
VKNPKIARSLPLGTTLPVSGLKSFFHLELIHHGEMSVMRPLPQCDPPSRKTGLTPVTEDDDQKNRESGNRAHGTSFTGAGTTLATSLSPSDNNTWPPAKRGSRSREARSFRIRSNRNVLRSPPGV